MDEMGGGGSRDPGGHASDTLIETAGRIELGTPAFLRTMLALFAAGFATFALLYYVQPLMPVFSDGFGVGPVGASLSLSLATSLLAVSMLVASTVSEVVGRKPVMVVSLLASAVLTILWALLSHWPTLLVVRALTGVTLSGLPAVAMAYVGEEMHPRSVGLAMGLYISGSGLGGMAGRLVTGVVSDFWGWRAAALVIGLLGLLCAAAVWRGLPASRNFRAREPRLAPLLWAFGAHLQDRVLALLFLEGFLLMGSFATIYNYIGYRLLAPPFSLSQTSVGLIFAIYLLGVISSTSTGALATRLGRARVLPATLALMLAGTVLTLSDRLWLIILGIAVLTIGMFGSHSIASSWVGLRARYAKAQASSLYLFAYYLGSSVLGSLGSALLLALAIATWLSRATAERPV
jgi:YNFM family putative membrane transporter